MAPSQPLQHERRRLRHAFGRFATGVTVVTTELENGQVHAMTANAFTSVSLDPPLTLISISGHCRMTELLPITGRYGISVLAEEHEELSWHFAGRSGARVKPRFVWAGNPSRPYVAGALAEFGCRVFDQHLAGDHTLFVGLVDHLAFRDGRPLIFYTGSHRSLRAGITDDPFSY